MANSDRCKIFLLILFIKPFLYRQTLCGLSVVLFSEFLIFYQDSFENELFCKRDTQKLLGQEAPSVIFTLAIGCRSVGAGSAESCHVAERMAVDSSW